jgi:hypothetical protein
VAVAVMASQGDSPLRPDEIPPFDERLVADVAAVLRDLAKETPNKSWLPIELRDAVNARDPAILQRLPQSVSALVMDHLVTVAAGKGFAIAREQNAIRIIPNLVPYTEEGRAHEPGWSRRQPRVYKFPEPVLPDHGTISLTDAALWIVSKGGRVEVTDLQTKEWDAAFEELFNAAGEIIGRRRGSSEDSVLRLDLRGKRRRYTNMLLRPCDSNLPSPADSVEEANIKRLFWKEQESLVPGGPIGFVECTFSPLRDLWNDGENDKLFQGWERQPEFTHLQVGAPFIKEQWPFRGTAFARDETKCERWLMEMMRESPNKRSKTQRQALSEAREKWPDLAERQFLRAWSDAVKKTGCSAWSKGGRPPLPR